MFLVLQTHGFKSPSNSVWNFNVTLEQALQVTVFDMARLEYQQLVRTLGFCVSVYVNFVHRHSSLSVHKVQVSEISFYYLQIGKGKSVKLSL
jgi:hypothetical protein